MGRIKTCLGYMTDITGLDLLSLVELGGNLEKRGICNLQKGTRS